MPKYFTDDKKRVRKIDESGGRPDSRSMQSNSEKVQSNDESFANSRLEEVTRKYANTVLDSKRIPILNQNTFYHATTQKNARLIVKHGFDPQLIGTATEKRKGKGVSLFGNKPNSGEGFYIAKNDETAKNYGTSIVKITMKNNAKIIDVQPYWLFGSGLKSKLPFLDKMVDWYVKDVKEYWNGKRFDSDEKEFAEKAIRHFEDEENIKKLKDSVDPRNNTRMMNGTFDPEEFIKMVKMYAKAHDYAGVNFDGVDTVIFDNDSIEKYEILKN